MWVQQYIQYCTPRHHNKMSHSKLNSDNIDEIDKDKDKETYDHVSKFLLELYLKSYFGYDGYISKKLVRHEFQQYLQRNKLSEVPQFKQLTGTLLQKNGFLLHTDKKSDMFRIRNANFRKYYFDVLKRMDEAQMQLSTSQISVTFNPSGAQSQVSDKFNIDTNDDEKVVEFQKWTETPIKNDFNLTNTGCFICQENFSSEETFDDHIEYHGEASGFKSTLYYKKSTKPDFELSYKTCKNSYLLQFTMKTSIKDILMEKIVIVRSRSMNYVRNEDVPFEMPECGVDHFYVDSHLFNIGIPQPIVLVYRQKNQFSSRYVAQYLFMRYEEFPIGGVMKLKSTRVVSRDEMKIGKLPKHFPPVELKELCKNNDFSEETLSNMFPKMRQYLEEKKELRPSNVCEIFKLLLQLEDLQISEQYEKLNRKCCEIKGYCGEYSVTLQNVPSDVIVSDTLKPFDEILLIPHKKNSGSRNSNTYANDENDKNDENGSIAKEQKGRKKLRKIVCYVYRIYGTKICFKPRDGQLSLHQKYDITFVPGRIPLIFQYQALELLIKKENLRRFLFPTINFNKTPSKLSLDFHNKSVEINPEQMQAVMNITDGPNKSAPYIIFGPPGTGKTTTVVESIYQLWKKDKKNKILVTAGSNAACDEVARKLCEIFTTVDIEGLNLLRIYAAAVEKRIDNMDEDLIEASNLCHNCHFYPSIDSINSYRVVVATLTVVGRLVQGKLNENCFSHIFIDECAASTEPEALVGIVGVLSSDAKLILSGDPKQLGPILQSDKAAELGLNLSLMERLLKRKCYEVNFETGEYDRSIQTRLVRNFRTHSDILHLSNMLYYENELIYCAKREITDWALGWNQLPCKNFPIIFNVVYGQTRKDRESRSLCNYKELLVTMDYVKNLMFFGINGRKITEDDIGVISPYKRQYNLIREELDKRSWYKIETGSVETFQGKEKPIIIISMVRSGTSSVGFLDNPRRLNVTLTRAQALMIIIGNPETLEQVDDWKEVIEYCKENRALTGAKYPKEECTNFKTSQSSLSTITNLDNNIKKQKNQRQNYRRRYGSNHIKHQSQRSKASDNISVSSNLEEHVTCWLEDTAKFREKFSENREVTSSTSTVRDSEIVKKNDETVFQPKTFGFITPIQKTIGAEHKVATIEEKKISLPSRATFPQQPKNLLGREEVVYQPKTLGFTTPTQTTIGAEDKASTIRGNKISSSSRVELPQQPKKSSAVVRPMPSPIDHNINNSNVSVRRSSGYTLGNSSNSMPNSRLFCSIQEETGQIVEQSGYIMIENPLRFQRTSSQSQAETFSRRPTAAPPQPTKKDRCVIS